MSDSSGEMHGCVRPAATAVLCCGLLVTTSASVAGGASVPADSSAEPAAEIANSAAKGFTYASVLDGQSVAVSRDPGARPYKRLPAYTEMGSPRHLPIVDVRTDAVAVAPTMKRNGKKVWLKRNSDDVEFKRTMYSVQVDLSRRTLKLRKGKHVVHTAKVAIGRPGSPTPTGRFAITDKLNGRKISSYYGCCVLALNAHQPNLPRGWTGGNRLAIHGTNSPGTIGTAASAGCVRARTQTLRKLMRRVPLGAPVFIRR